MGMGGKGGGGGGGGGATFNSELWSGLLGQLLQSGAKQSGGGGLAGGLAGGFNMGSVIGKQKQANERGARTTELERRLRFMEALTQTDQRTGEL